MDLFRDPLFCFLLLFVAVITYGSLYPFRLIEVRSLPAEIDDFFDWSMGDRSDVLANLALFVPIGYVATLLLRRYQPARPIASLALISASAALLALVLQVGQLFVQGRVPSLVDAFWNTWGTLFGAAVGLVWRLVPFNPNRAEGSTEGAHFPLVIASCWLAYRLMPFVPSLDWQSIKQSLKPLFLHPDVSFVDLMGNSGGWLLFSVAWKHLSFPATRRITWVWIIPVVLLLEILVVHNEVTADNVAGALAAIAIEWATRNAGGTTTVALWTGAAIVAMELEGVQLEAPRSAFHWTPFYGFLDGSLLLNLQQLVLKLTFYGGQVYALARIPMNVTLAGLITAFGLFGLEYVQTFAPSRTAEVTDALLALLAAGALRAMMPVDSRSRVPGRTG